MIRQHIRVIRRHSASLISNSEPIRRGIGLRCVSSVKISAECKTRVLEWPSYADKGGRSFREAYDIAAAFLRTKDVPEADISARYLLCDAAGTGYRMSDFHKAMSLTNTHRGGPAGGSPPPQGGAGDGELQLSATQWDQLGKHCKLRAQRMPVQYIIGNWDFYGLVLNCKPPVLIPRPETEELVELILNRENVLPTGAKVLDIGAGTGAIGLALLSQRSDITCVGIDVHPGAVALSRENAAMNESKVRDVHTRYACYLQSVAEYASSGAGDGLFDIIVSNPPYIPSDEMLSLAAEVSRFEDRVALHGGLDGLDTVREIVLHAARLLRPAGPGEVWLEVARQHPSQIQAWMSSLSAEKEKLSGPGPGPGLDLEFVEAVNDLSGYPRFARLRLRPRLEL